MILPQACIRRPVMTTLLMLCFVIFGAASYRQLPVAALPRVDFPTINVSASLPGASPETMASSVASVLERQFSSIAGVASMTSSSSPGSTSITLQFNLDRNIDAAALDVQAALSVAQRRLPSDMPAPPSFRKVNPADQPILFLAFISNTLPLTQVNEFAESVIGQQISQLPGVAQVQVFGTQKYAVRIQVDPDKAAARNIALADIRQAVVAANSNVAVGVMDGPRQSITLQATGQMEKARDYAALVIAMRNGAPIRLEDVADVRDGVENERVAAWTQGDRTITLAIFRQPDANTVAVVDAVKAKIPQFQAQIPPSVQLRVLNDRSLSIRDAVEDVEFTLALSIALVVMVIFLFLRSIPATIIPSLAVPVSVVGTFAAMHLLGFSINNMTLLALTLCVGFVVDDAIVMLENIMRHVEEGMSPYAAAMKGSREIGFTILSITFSLIAVFIPVLMMGGVVGRIFREFAVTISIAILISGIVSLTLTPMLCSRLLTAPAHGRRLNGVLRTFEAGFEALTALYRTALQWTLKHKFLMLMVTFATLAASVFMFGAVKKGFFPIEDTGFLFARTEGPTDTSFAAMRERQLQVMDIVMKDPAVDYVQSVVGVGGMGGTANVGTLFVALKQTKDRPLSKQTGRAEHANEVIERLRNRSQQVPGIRTFLQNVQNIAIGGRSSKAMYQYTLTGSNPEELYRWAGTLEKALAKVQGLRDVTSDLYITNPQIMIDVDRDRGALYGITLEQVRQALANAYASRAISTIFTAANDYPVILEFKKSFSDDASDLASVYLKASGGQSVPIETVASLRRTVGPLQVQHQGQQPAVTLSFNLAPGFALSDAVEAVQKVEREAGLPPTVTTGFAGTAQVFQDSLGGQGLLILLALFVTYVVLGILYESYIHPITILAGLPSAGLGALLVLQWFDMELTVIAIIGLVMLIGIVKKNAIMMIDFALEARRHGLSAEKAIFEACLVRFRPIMMTTLAALFGVLPIALGHGAGSEVRQPLGIVVVGGLMLSQVLTLFITPVIYLYLERLAMHVSGHPPALPEAEAVPYGPLAAPGKGRRRKGGDPSSVAAE